MNVETENPAPVPADGGPPPAAGRWFAETCSSRCVLPLFLMAEVVLFTLLVPEFLTTANLLNLGRQMSVLGIVSAGATFGLISGAVDLSVGSVAALSGMLGGWFLREGQPAAVAIGGPLTGCLGIGLANGVIVTKLRVNPIVATLGMMSIVRGAALVCTGATALPIRDETYGLFQQYWLGLPLPLALLALVILLAHIVLKHTRFGRYAFAIGGNPDASRRLAIPVDRLRIGYLAVSGFLAGLAGWVLASMSGAATASAGQGYELTVITIVILGGVSLSGGVGSMVGTALAALIIGVMVNGLTLLGVDSFYQMIVQGGVLLVAVVADARRSGGYE